MAICIDVEGRRIEDVFSDFKSKLNDGDVNFIKTRRAFAYYVEGSWFGSLDEFSGTESPRKTHYCITVSRDITFTVEGIAKLDQRNISAPECNLWASDPNAKCWFYHPVCSTSAVTSLGFEPESDEPGGKDAPDI